MKALTRKTMVAGTAVAALAVAALGVHLGCKDQAGADFTKVLANAGGQITGRPEVGRLGAAAADYAKNISVNASDEDGMGQAVAMSLTNTYPLTIDERLNKYVSMVGLAIVDASPRPVGNWLFGVLESNDVNAFAGPNGYIFVTTGALRIMRDESELAGVLAHELTHVLHHHGLNGVRADANAELLKEVASVAVSSQDRYGMFEKLADPAVDAVVRKPYGRSQELDADRTAVSLVVAAGYDPNGLVRFLERLESTGGDVFSTHPGKAERISSARAQIAKLGNPTGKTLRDRFERSTRPGSAQDRPRAERNAAQPRPASKADPADEPPVDDSGFTDPLAQ